MAGNLSGHSWFGADYAGMIGDDIAVILVRRSELDSFDLLETVDLGTDPATQQRRTAPLVSLSTSEGSRASFPPDSMTTPTLDDLRNWLAAPATSGDTEGTDEASADDRGDVAETP